MMEWTIKCENRKKELLKQVSSKNRKKIWQHYFKRKKERKKERKKF